MLTVELRKVTPWEHQGKLSTARATARRIYRACNRAASWSCALARSSTIFVIWPYRSSSLSFRAAVIDSRRTCHLHEGSSRERTWLSDGVLVRRGGGGESFDAQVVGTAAAEDIEAVGDDEELLR